MKRVTTRSGLDFSHYDTTLAYLRDIIDGLPVFYQDVLLNDSELNHENRIPRRLQDARPKRDLVLDDDLYFSSKKVSKIVKHSGPSYELLATWFST